MEVITIESQAFRNLTAKINTIAKFVAAIRSKSEEEPEDGWVDSYEVCTFLKITAFLLIRANGALKFTVPFSEIRFLYGGLLVKRRNFLKIQKVSSLSVIKYAFFFIVQ